MADLEDHAGAIVGLSPALQLAYLNPAWFRFARENGGEPRISHDWPLGRSIVESWHGPFRALYEPHYRSAFRTGDVWTHEYDCSAPDTPRYFHQIVYPLADGLLVVHSLSVAFGEAAARDPTALADPSRYVADGVILQCMYCRRVRRPEDLERWDWIPEWATGFPPTTSHGLCQTCYRFYYPG